jgi:antigen flippase
LRFRARIAARDPAAEYRPMMLRALLTIGGVQVITMLVLLVRTKTIAVMLGPEYLGVMAVIDKLLAVIAQTVSLSLPFAAVRFLPERWAAGPAEFRDLFTRMRNVLLALILAATAVALLVTLFRPAAWGEALMPYRAALTAAIFGLPAIGFIPFLQNAFAGRLQQNRSMMVGLAHALVLTAAAAGIWWLGILGYYAVYAVLALVLVVVVARLAAGGAGGGGATAEPVPRARAGLGLPGAIWRFSGTLLALSFLAPYAALFVHYLLLRDHGAQTAGWMQAAIGIGFAVRAVLGSAHAVFLTPNVNRGGSPEDRMTWANQFQTTFCLIAGLCVPLLLLFPDLVIELLYSSAFSPGAAFAMVFVLTEVVGLLGGTYQSLVVALDHLRFHVVNNGIALLLVVVAAYYWVGPFGILGAGLAGLVAPTCLYVSTMIFLHRAHGLRMPRHVALRSGWLLLALIGAGLVGALFREMTWEFLLYKIATFAVIAGGFASLLTGHERRRMRETLVGWRTGS